ncbi:MAG: hypothetical protein EOP04_02090 [Proteobacteria bacterium]|nr:MAG: hypothetical protein EOP04_02090 [Pseudomonadota bacterium]
MMKLQFGLMTLLVGMIACAENGNLVPSRRGPPVPVDIITEGEAVKTPAELAAEKDAALLKAQSDKAKIDSDLAAARDKVALLNAELDNQMTAAEKAVKEKEAEEAKKALEIAETEQKALLKEKDSFRAGIIMTVAKDKELKDIVSLTRAMFTQSSTAEYVSKRPLNLSLIVKPNCLSTPSTVYLDMSYFVSITRSPRAIRSSEPTFGSITGQMPSVNLIQVPCDPTKPF